MRDECQAVTAEAIDGLIRTLPRPAKDTFLIAFNQHETHVGERFDANPFRRFFLLADALEEKERKIGRFECKRGWTDPETGEIASRSANRVPATNPELESEIAQVTEDFKAVLPPESHGILESRKVRQLFALARLYDRETRQIDDNLKWEVRERREALVARHQQMIERLTARRLGADGGTAGGGAS